MSGIKLGTSFIDGKSTLFLSLERSTPVLSCVLSFAALAKTPSLYADARVRDKFVEVRQRRYALILLC